MQCPECNGDTRVSETRLASGRGVRRRRTCVECGSRFSTIEAVVGDVVVLKRDRTLESLDRRKITSSIVRAAHVAPLKTADVNAITERIERNLMAEGVRGPIPTSRIGDAVLDALSELEPPADLARIRYAMVFLGRSDRPGQLSNASELIEWLHSNYGTDAGVYATDDPNPQWVTKKDGRRAERFDLDKVIQSIEVALQNRGEDRAIRNTAFTVASEVAEALNDQPVVSSLQIGSEVLKLLREVDGLAYLRFGATFKMINRPDLIALDATSVLAIELDKVLDRHPTRGPHDPTTD